MDKLYRRSFLPVPFTSWKFYQMAWLRKQELETFSVNWFIFNWLGRVEKILLYYLTFSCSLLHVWLGILVNQFTLKVKVAQSCLTVHNPMDCSPPGSSVHGILLARILEWVAILESLENITSIIQFLNFQRIGIKRHMCFSSGRRKAIFISNSL